MDGLYAGKYSFRSNILPRRAIFAATTRWLKAVRVREALDGVPKIGQLMMHWQLSRILGQGYQVLPQTMPATPN